ncbi:MAG: D-alanyl-D-alanine carboxypeptidase/D-alanyl-D-alanine-endopeptidase [Holophagales bacterium]|nr:D-alanyl-D-alanine carboxypeptidase/D-alanyl-D-alanine-endopeptidase [Holophagales bacterium]
MTTRERKRSRSWGAVWVVAVLAFSGGPAESASSRKATAPRKLTVFRPAREMTLSERLAAVARRGPVRDRSQVAVAIAPVGQPVVFSYNADAELILASTTKLFTTAAALDRLGPGYRFRTTLLREGELLPDGTLPGRLVIRGGGDPAISGRLYDNDPWAVFRPWSEALAARGVRSIRDGLLLDTSFFDDERTHPDWPAAQEQHWWQAPVSALSYNDNVVLVRVTGAFRPGGRASLGFYPAQPFLMSVVGRVSTHRGRGANVGVSRRAGSPRVVASGVVGSRTTWSGDVTVVDPPLYLAAAFTKVLRETGIEVGGPPEVRTQAPRQGTPQTVLHVHETPILPVLAVCNKRSQSFYAEQVLKTLGAERRGSGTWEAGRSEVAEFLRSLGLDPSRYRIADGSGRSRENRSTAAAYLDFLQALATRWRHFQAFEPTLAVTGDMAGSLRYRMLGADTRGKVFAKTGNIAGVVTLTGYVEARSGQRYAFVILANGGCSEGRGHAWQDRILAELARWG